MSWPSPPITVSRKFPSTGASRTYRETESKRNKLKRSPYQYDRRVPMIFMGAGVEAGVSHRAVRTVDLARTLAKLARMPIPVDLDGQPLLTN